MQFLLENGADPNGFYTYDNKHVSYLERIAHSSLDTDLAEFLINWGADVNGYTTNSDKDQITPIYACAAHHRISQDAASAMAQLFIEHGAFLENKDHWGYTPFLKAIDMKSYRMINVLADGGANLSAKTKQGKNALQIALDKNDLQLYKHIQDIMARGQQPSQYQPSKPQTQRRTSESGGNASGDDELVTFEQNTNKKSTTNKQARLQEISDFLKTVKEAGLTERKGLRIVTEIMNNIKTMSISERSSKAKESVSFLEKAISLQEPSKILPKMKNCTQEEKELFNDALQIKKTQKERFLDAVRIYTVERELTQEDWDKIVKNMNSSQDLDESVSEIWDRVVEACSK